MPNKKKYYHKRAPKADNYNPPFGEEILSQSIDVLSLRDDTKNLLVNSNITTLREVLKREEKDFYRISTFNKKNLNDILRAVSGKKLYLKPAKKPDEIKEKQNNQVTNEGQKYDKNAVGIREFKRPKSAREDRSIKKNAANERNYNMVTLIKRPPKPEMKQQPEPHDIYVKVNKNGKWGFKQRDGKQMPIAPIYEEVFMFKDDLCCVQKDDKFGFINRQGEEIIPVEYDCASSFSEGYACVYKNDKCGYIDKENKVVIDFIFDAGTAVENGECRVKKDGKWGELHIYTPDNIIAEQKIIEDGAQDENIKIHGLGIKNIRWIV